MKTMLYLDGKKAYIRRNGIVSKKVNKHDFLELLNETDKTIYAVVLKEKASAYEHKMNDAQYVTIDKNKYDMFTLIYKFEKKEKC